MKKLLTLFLAWLITFSAMAETTLKAKSALSAAGGYVTSQNKVDGSFEDGISSWSASVGTIVKTASTEIQGNYVGVWSGTGTGTLDLLWTATASNTYELSAQIKLDVPSDYTLCGVVNGTETGCKVLSGYVANKIYKASVIADSVLGTSFYLRLKHTGSGTFSATVDDGKIEPQSFQNVQVMEQGSLALYGNAGGAVTPFVTDIPFTTTVKNSIPSTIGSWSSSTTYKANRKQQLVLSARAEYTSGSSSRMLTVYKDGIDQRTYGVVVTNGTSLLNTTIELNTGESITIREVGTGGNLSNVNTHVLFITATAITDSVITSYQDGTEWKSLTYTEVNALSGNQGFGAFTAGGVEWKRDGGDLLYKGKLTVGTTSASEARIPLPNGLVSANTTVIPSLQFLGIIMSDATSSLYSFQALAEPSVGYFTIGRRDSSINGLVKQNGNSLWNAGTQISFNFSIPISGWSSRPTLYAMSNRAEVFSSNVSASGTVSNASNNFVTSCTNATPSVCSLWASFGVAPICWSHTLDITKRAEVTATTATTATVARTDTGTAFNLFCHLK